MNKQKLILTFVLMLACSFTAAASDVYKRVNEDGIIEFSDRPSSDADKIDVKPNVVETNPVARRTPTASSADTKVAAESPNRQSSVNSTTNRRERTTRDASRNSREKRQSREQDDRDLVADPDPGRATRNAARAIGGP